MYILLYRLSCAFSIAVIVKISSLLCVFFRIIFKLLLDKRACYAYNNIRWFERAADNIAELCKGSTTDSDSVCEGSNPSSATILPNCVRVARQTLTLFVRVRILLRQPEQTAENARSRRFFLFFGPPPSPAGASARAVTEITGANLPRLPCPARLPRTNAPLVRYGTALPPRGAAQDAKTAERRLRRSVSIHQSSSSMSR